MTISYVMDDGARRADKNAWPTAEQAIEKALEAARKLQRAVSVWEWDSERKGEWPQVPSARVHYCLVFPDGSTQKSAKGENPFKVHMDENSDSGSTPSDSVEKALGLPTITLGHAVSQIDVAMQEAAGRIDQSVMDRLHVIGDKLASITAKRVERSRKIVTSFKRGTVHRIGGEKLILAEANPKTGILRFLRRDHTDLNVDALTLARELVRADQEADAHHLAPGDVAVVDEKDRAFVLDSADEVYVVLQEGNIETVPDDVTRIRRASDAGDPEAKKVRRVWQAFYRSLLKFFDVASVDEMDSEQKSRMFDMARRKWPKVSQKLLEPKPESAPESKPEEQPAQQPGQQPAQPAASAQPAVAYDHDGPDEGAPDEDDMPHDEPFDDEDPLDVAHESRLADDINGILQKIGAQDRAGWDISDDPSVITFWDDETHSPEFVKQLQQALQQHGAGMFEDVQTVNDPENGPCLHAVLTQMYMSELGRHIIGDEEPEFASTSARFKSSWSNGPTLLSYCMDLFKNDVEVSTKLAMSFMAASLRDATKLRAMKSMKKFEGHELPKNWFETAMLLAETSKRSNVKASKAIDLTPPKDVQKIAARAIERAHKEGVTLPSITAQHAKLLVAGKPISLEAAERMHMFLTRHQLTAKSELLWDAWGGHAGKRWVDALAQLINPVQAGVVKKEWKQAFNGALDKMIRASLLAGGLDENAKIATTFHNDGRVGVFAKDARHAVIIAQIGEKLGWKVKTAVVGENAICDLIGGPGLQKLYYEANKAYHKKLGVPWTAQLEKVWQHKLAEHG